MAKMAHWLITAGIQLRKTRVNAMHFILVVFNQFFFKRYVLWHQCENANMKKLIGRSMKGRLAEGLIFKSFFTILFRKSHM